MRKALNRIAKKKSAGLEKIPAKKPRLKVEDNADVWKWTKRRRRVVDLCIKGFTQKEIAQEVGKSRRTIIRWMQHEEFQKEVLKILSEQGRQTSFRRAYTTRLAADQVTSRMLMALDRLKDAQEEEYKRHRSGNKLTPQEEMRNFRQRDQFMQEFVTAQRSFTDLRTHERLDMGQSTENKRVHHTGQVQTQVLGVSFEDMLVKHKDQLQLPAPKENATDGELIVEQMRAVLRDTDVLEDVAAQDAQMLAENAK